MSVASREEKRVVRTNTRSWGIENGHQALFVIFADEFMDDAFDLLGNELDVGDIWGGGDGVGGMNDGTHCLIERCAWRPRRRLCSFRCRSLA